MEDGTGDSPTLASTLTDAGAALAGRYRVRARLGRGASKEVYLAYDERLDREVALAIVVGAASSASARARVEREAQVTGRLGDHPNVITVYDVGEHDGVPYLVLRAMGGGSLACAMARERLAVADVLRIGREIAAALAHAHAHGIVHRDVKPDNVWLAADGSAALGDFGIAHLAGADRLTAEGIVVGTVRYLAPEQIRGEVAGPASDLYALGVTLYELVTGRPPFHGRGPGARAHPAPDGGAGGAVAACAGRAARARAADHGAARQGAAAPPRVGRRGRGGARRDERERDRRRRRRRAPAAARRAGRAPARRGARRARRRRRPRGPARAARPLQRGHRAARRQRRAPPRRRARRRVRADRVARRRRDARRARRRRAARGDRRAAARARVRRGLPRRRTARHDGRHRRGDHRRRRPGRARRARRDPARRRRSAPPSQRDAAIDADSGRLLELRARAAGAAAHAGDAVRRPLAASSPRCTPRSRGRATSAPAGSSPSPERRGSASRGWRGEFLGAAARSGDRARGPLPRLRRGHDVPRARRHRARARAATRARASRSCWPATSRRCAGVLSAIGLSDEPAQAEETAWALRRLLERLARDRPLVVAIEDIHWAEPPLLDLLDHVVALSSGSPILLVCLTRPELLETHPGVGRAAAQPLGARARRARRRRRRASSPRASAPTELSPRGSRGAPRATRCSSSSSSPSTAGRTRASCRRASRPCWRRASTASERGERTLLQHAAVEGRTFHAGALAALLPSRRAPRAGDAPRRARAQGADRRRSARVSGRGRLSLHPRAHPRGGLRGAVQGGRAPSSTRTSRGGWRHSREPRTRSSATTSSGPASSRPSSGRPASASDALARRAAQRLEAASRAALARGDAQASQRLPRARDRRSSRPTMRCAARCCPRSASALFEAGRMVEAAQVLDDAIAHASATRRPGTRTRRARVRAAGDRDERPGRRDGLRISRRGAARCFASARPTTAASRAPGRCARQRLRGGAPARRRRGMADAPRTSRDVRAISASCSTSSNGGRRPPSSGPCRFPRRYVVVRSSGEIVAASPRSSASIFNALAVLHAMQGGFDRADRYLRRGQRDPRRVRRHWPRTCPTYEAIVRMLGGQPERAEAVLRADIGRPRVDERNEHARDDDGDARPGGLRAGARRRGRRAVPHDGTRHGDRRRLHTSDLPWRAGEVPRARWPVRRR